MEAVDKVVFKCSCMILIVICSVANGFVLPLKEEHVVFFHQTLLPLYRRYTTRRSLLELCAHTVAAALSRALRPL